jgi:arabinogalactan endo-1,4-beta-galactosidase
MENVSREDYLNSLVAIYDYLKLIDKEIIENNIEIDMLNMNEETLTGMLFRKLNAYNIDLNKELGWDHLKPIS